jgi:hypothetical protein
MLGSPVDLKRGEGGEEAGDYDCTPGSPMDLKPDNFEMSELDAAAWGCEDGSDAAAGYLPLWHPTLMCVGVPLWLPLATTCRTRILPPTTCRTRILPPTTCRTRILPPTTCRTRILTPTTCRTRILPPLPQCSACGICATSPKCVSTAVPDLPADGLVRCLTRRGYGTARSLAPEPRAHWDCSTARGTRKAGSGGGVAIERRCCWGWKSPWR